MSIQTRLAAAKINLTLEILGKRPDGYHDIASVMHKIPFGDTVTVEDTRDGSIAFDCDKPVCPPAENLAFRAAKIFENAYGKALSFRISVAKRVPAGSGLGGGSADAAAVLDLLNERFRAFSEAELETLAASLGSDVPFLLAHHTCALCTGRGEIMTELPPLRFDLSLLFPSAPLSTSGIYAAYDALHEADYTKHNSTDLAAVLKKGAARVPDASPFLCNDFEAVCVERCPGIGDCKEKLRREGYAAQMSGSGSAVFGIR